MGFFQNLSARLAGTATDADDTAEATPQARDEAQFLIDSEEHTEEPVKADLNAWVEEYEENPFIRIPTRLYVSDVVEPGYEIEVASRDPTADPDSFTEPTVPTSYPNKSYHDLELSAALERWLARSVITGNSFNRDFRVLMEQVLTDAIGRRGTGLAEHVYDDPETRQRLLGLRAFSVEDVTAYTRGGKAILIRPDDTSATLHRGDGPGVEPSNAPTIALDEGDRDDIPTTPAGKAAAFVQYDDIFSVDEREEIKFALDDVTMIANDPDTGELFGRPESAAVTARSKALRTQLEDVDQGLKNAAWNNIIANVNTDDETKAKKMLAGLDPNSPESISVTNTQPDITELNGEVPDVVEHIKQQVEYIVAGLPVPLYRVGFEGDINRDVTSEQSDDYPNQVARTRREVEAAFRRMVELKANEFITGHAHPDDAEEGDLYGDPSDVPDVRLHVRPDGDSNPFRSDHFDAQAFNNLTTGLKNVAPGGEVGQLVKAEAILDLIPGMDPEEAMPETMQEAEEMTLGPLDESDPDVQQAFAEFTGTDQTDQTADLAAQYSEGDEVDTPAGVGVVVEIRTEAFTGPDGEEVEPSEDSPAYVVAVEEGAKVYRASDLSSGTIEVEEVDDPEAALGETQAALDIADATGDDPSEISELAGDDGRQFDYPQSWKDSPTPNRIILLKAWAGLGGRFTTCRARLGSARLCASMKDSVLQWEGWRN